VVQEKCITNVCQPGDNLLAAGYCMYSSSTILTLTVGHGVYSFTLDPSIGEFVMSHEDVKIPATGKIYSFNEGNFVNWEPGLKEYMDAIKKGGKANDGKPYSARYIGSLVGDFHRTMLYGGIYGTFIFIIVWATRMTSRVFYSQGTRVTTSIKTVNFACCTSAPR
jgi:fructose-1,6-bisphosphatase I